MHCYCQIREGAACQGKLAYCPLLTHTEQTCYPRKASPPACPPTQFAHASTPSPVLPPACSAYTILPCFTILCLTGSYGSFKTQPRKAILSEAYLPFPPTLGFSYGLPKCLPFSFMGITHPFLFPHKPVRKTVLYFINTRKHKALGPSMLYSRCSINVYSLCMQ